MEDATTSRFERVEFAIRRRRLSESMKVDSSRDDSLVLTHCFYNEYTMRSTHCPWNKRIFCKRRWKREQQLSICFFKRWLVYHERERKTYTCWFLLIILFKERSRNLVIQKLGRTVLLLIRKPLQHWRCSLQDCTEKAFRNSWLCPQKMGFSNTQ